MYRYFCIGGWVLLVILWTSAVRAASPTTHTPDTFTPDSAAKANPVHLTERNQRLYDSIQSKSSRRAVPRMIYKMLFVRPVLDTTASGRVTDESSAIAAYAGKRIGEITIDRQQVFDPNGNWLERTGNKTHHLTRDRVIRRDLLFRTGDPLDPEQIVRNKQLIRSRNYISDVDIAVRPDSTDSTQVNIHITTRDSWSITVDAGVYSQGRSMIGLSDYNLLGWGNRLTVKTNLNYKDFSYGGNQVEYEIPNLLGSFYTTHIEGGRNFYSSTLDVGISKEFLRPTDYELGLSYSNIKDRRYMIEPDTSLLIRQRNVDLWGGYSHYLNGLRSSIYVTAHYNNRRVSLRPPVWEKHNPILHDQDAFLVGLGLYREKFYTANMIYGFGRREYLAAGYKAELVSGYAWGEFSDAMYLGMDYHRGGFHPLGYFTGGATLGSYIDLDTGEWNRSAIDVDLGWFSNLFLVRRTRIRQFLELNYTQGWNRFSGSDESIRFTRYKGLQALKEHTIGTNRMIINTETVVFTPYQPLGFRIAFFGFADFGLIGYDANIFRNSFYSSFGLGIRLRNERLVFNTLQIRLGIAVGKHGLVESEYFRVSSARRIEQMRYRPARPEIVGFK